MGTTWSAQVVAPPAGLAAALHAELAATIAAMSQWEPTSALSRFNAAPVGEWHALPADLLAVIDAALAIGARTGGAFDPAAGALADLWGFGPPGPRRDLPAAEAVAAARERSGSDALDRDGKRLRRRRAVRLDLSGIAKGHAVDRLAAACRAHGCGDFLVEIGGECVGSGIRPDGQPWWVELEDPPGLTLAPLRIALHGIAVATSGDYRRYLAAGTRRLGHTLDPRTGRPIDNGSVSVSVVAPDCMTADGWATALTVLGPDTALEAAEREGLAARIVTRNVVELLSPALIAMLD